MRPVLLDLGGLRLSSWGTLIAAGILAAIFLGRRLSPLLGLDRAVVLPLVVWTIVPGIFGAHAWAVASAWERYAGRPAAILNPFSGTASFGALALALPAAALFAWAHRIPFGRLCDLGAPMACLALLLARVGCALAGCCGGASEAAPVQLYEAAGCGLILLTLLAAVRRRSFEGQAAALAVALYGALRCATTPWRADADQAWASANQAAAVLLVLAGLLLLARRSEAPAAACPGR